MNRQQTILIVEDNEQSRLLLRDILTHYGYAILEARTGVEGVKVARKCLPDLVLMDIQMPEMDGITATRMLKADQGTNRFTIIALTSFAMSGDREMLLEAGFDDYVAKPVDTRQLPQLLKKYLDIGRDGE